MQIDSEASKLRTLHLRTPYAILIADVQQRMFAKTALGIVHWRRELVAGQIRFPGCPVDLGVPDVTVPDAVRLGVGSLVLGVAAIGGAIPGSWLKVIEEAAIAGLDIVSGMHQKLSELPTVAAAAAKSGAHLVDVRDPPKNLPVGSGKKRTGRRILMVGTECGVGKKYSALALNEEMQRAGLNSTFRASGQTGIMIAGTGIPIDAVVADFISGAAEALSPDNDHAHWDIIEGQGSLFHPAYAGVALGLLHGSQPDGIVVCHDAVRKEVSGWAGYSLPSISECVERNLLEGRLTNPAIQCLGISVNTSGLPSHERSSYLAALHAETGIPCVDPIAGGCEAIVDVVRSRFT